ncbi:hypothetical protein BJ546DRAFT_98881 [Cryomyces antarcticus]
MQASLTPSKPDAMLRGSRHAARRGHRPHLFVRKAEACGITECGPTAVCIRMIEVHQCLRKIGRNLLLRRHRSRTMRHRSPRRSFSAHLPQSLPVAPEGRKRLRWMESLHGNPGGHFHRHFTLPDLSCWTAASVRLECRRSGLEAAWLEGTPLQQGKHADKRKILLLWMGWRSPVVRAPLRPTIPASELWQPVTRVTPDLKRYGVCVWR